MADLASAIAKSLEDNRLFRAGLASEFISREVKPVYDDLIRVLIHQIVAEVFKADEAPSAEMIAAVRDQFGGEAAAYAGMTWPTMFKAAVAAPVEVAE